METEPPVSFSRRAPDGARNRRPAASRGPSHDWAQPLVEVRAHRVDESSSHRRGVRWRLAKPAAMAKAPRARRSERRFRRIDERRLLAPRAEDGADRVRAVHTARVSAVSSPSATRQLAFGHLPLIACAMKGVVEESPRAGAAPNRSARFAFQANGPRALAARTLTRRNRAGARARLGATRRRGVCGDQARSKKLRLQQLLRGQLPKRPQPPIGCRTFTCGAVQDRLKPPVRSFERFVEHSLPPEERQLERLQSRKRSSYSTAGRISASVASTPVEALAAMPLRDKRRRSFERVPRRRCPMREAPIACCLRTLLAT